MYLPTSVPTFPWSMATSNACSMTSRSGIITADIEASNITVIKDSFMSALLWFLYSSSIWLPMPCMFDSLNLQNKVFNNKCYHDLHLRHDKQIKFHLKLSLSSIFSKQEHFKYEHPQN